VGVQEVKVQKLIQIIDKGDPKITYTIDININSYEKQNITYHFSKNIPKGATLSNSYE